MYNNYIKLLNKRLTPKRFLHTLNVAEVCVKLAGQMDYDKDKAYLAGLLHDICKNDSAQKQLQMIKEFDIILDNVSLSQRKLWHAPCGAAYIKHKLGIEDNELLDAVRYHTTARAGMTTLDKIVYLADFISDDRDFDGVEKIRRAARISTQSAIYECLKFSVLDLAKRDKPIHTDTIGAYNEYAVSERI